jgi:hypothetical protein
MKIFVALALLALMIGSLTADDGWSFQVAPIWMDVYGYDLHVGDIWKYKQIWTVDEMGGWHIDYSIEYEPMILAMKNKFAWQFGLNYQKNDWAIGASGLYFSTSSQTEGMVFTPPFEAIPNGYIGYIYGVRMWDHTLVPVINEQEASGFSPVGYAAESKLKLFSGEVLLKYYIDFGVSFDFGLKFAQLFPERMERQTQHAYYTYTAPFWVIFDNYITLQSKSKVNYQLLRGPNIGFEIEKKNHQINLKTKFSQAVLFGNVESIGKFEDTDDIDWFDYHSGELIYHDHYYGHFTFEKVEKVLIPVTEFNLNLSVSLNKKVDLGLSFYGSAYFNTPLAPKWSVPGEWTCVNGTSWVTQRGNLFFTGSGLNITFKF